MVSTVSSQLQTNDVISFTGTFTTYYGECIEAGATYSRVLIYDPAWETRQFRVNGFLLAPGWYDLTVKTDAVQVLIPGGALTVPYLFAQVVQS